MLRDSPGAGRVAAKPTMGREERTCGESRLAGAGRPAITGCVKRHPELNQEVALLVSCDAQFMCLLIG